MPPTFGKENVEQFSFAVYTFLIQGAFFVSNYKCGGMKMKRKILSLLLASLMVVSFATGCAKQAPVEEPAVEVTTEVAEATEEVTIENPELILATTTSTENSGLLDYILPKFEEKTGMSVKVIAVGTGKALQMGVDGEADVLLVHAKASEEAFVAAGDGTERSDVMYNDFVLIGPSADPADIGNKAPTDIIEALKLISSTESKFISRGDDSGTHKKELSIWQTAELEPSGDWYVEAGKGMGDVIMMANEMQGYTLTDRATYLSMKENIDLNIVTEKDSSLFNQYGVIPVNPAKNDSINEQGANIFVEWLLSDETQELIETFGVEEFGQPLFIPNAVK